MIKQLKQFAKSARRFVCGPRLRRCAIARGVRNLGVQPGGILLLHSSLSALGYVVGGASAVVAGIRDVLGPTGTLIVPTHTWEWMDSGCRLFDIRRTPACVGKIPEFFRSLPEVVRSIHPTHSVCAVGSDAVWLIDGHEHATTPCGNGTPYAKLLDRNGQILLLGCGLQTNTAFHTIEALTNAPYLMREEAEYFDIIDAVGHARRMPFRRHMSGIARCFPIVEDLLLKRGVATIGSLGPARTLLISGLAFRKLMISALREQPSLFLESADLSTAGTVAAEPIGLNGFQRI